MHQLWQRSFYEQTRKVTGRVCGSDLLCKLQVASLNSLCLLGEGHILEEGDGLLLPEDSVVLLLEVHKGIAGLAVPDVRQPCLHSQAKVITDDLQPKSE